MSSGVIRRANPRAGFASSDGCRMFHDDGEYLRHCAKFPDCNVYVHLPHALDATMQRLDSSSSTTSFDNAQAMLCHLAAGCLTLRGCNVDRAFGTVGAGGAGQSLFSYTVANLFGKDSHRFLDMNVHYTERGMTKAGGAFGWKARCDRSGSARRSQGYAGGPVQKAHLRRPGVSSTTIYNSHRTSAAAGGGKGSQ